VEQGRNTFTWNEVHRPDDIKGCKEAYPMDQPFAGDNLLGLQFHVIPDEDGETDTPFSFCISDIQFLTEEHDDE
jgi:hypothetical protein